MPIKVLAQLCSSWNPISNITPVGPISLCDNGSNSPVILIADTNGAGANAGIFWNDIDYGQTNMLSLNINSLDLLINGNTYQYSFVIYNSIGCQQNSNFVTVTIVPSVPISVSINANHSSPICFGTTMIFTATPFNGGANPIFNFQVNGISVQNGIGSTYTSSNLNNNDIVSCTMTSNAPCASSATASSNNILVSVNPPPVINSSSNSPVCTGNALSLFSTVSANNSWTGPNNFISALQNPVITNVTATNAGIYTVTVIGANGCTASSSISVAITSPLTYFADIDQDGYGVSTISQTLCAPTGIYSTTLSGDADDNDPNINPGIGNIQVTSEIQNNPILNTPQEMFNGGAFSNGAIKVCGDGSDVTKIYYTKNNPSVSISDIRIKIVNQNVNNPDNFLYGYFTADAVSGNVIMFTYHHPQIGHAAHETILIYDNSNQHTLGQLDLKVYNAPVLFVHGLWGDASAFQTMEQSFINDPLYFHGSTMRADYHKSNAKSFSANADVVPRSIDILLQMVRVENVSAGKVDVVAHSMGGVLSRIYLQHSYSDAIDYRDDIRTLTTLNTPHSGTQLADYLLSNHAPPLLVSTLEGTGRQIYDGAINDLGVNSTAVLDDLNGAVHLNASAVPSRTITSIGDVIQNSSSGDKQLLGLIFLTNKTYWNSINIFNISSMEQYLFFGSSDFVVPYESQIGGTDATINFQGAVHNEAEKNQSIISNILAGFKDRNQFLNNYAPNFIPSILQVHPDLSHSLTTVQSLNTGSVTINTNGTYFNGGDQLNVTVGSTGSVQEIVSIICNQNEFFVLHDTMSGSQIFNYSIPADYSGSLTICSFGMDNTGILAVDTQVVFVGTSASADSVWTPYDQWFISAGDTSSLEIYAHFNDGIIRNISSFPGIQYHILNAAVLQHTSGNSFASFQTGASILKCIYSNDTAVVNVTVMPKDTGSVLNASISSSGPITFCAGGQVTLTAAINNHYEWSTGATTQSITVNSPGIYNVKVSDGLGAAASSSINIRVNSCSIDLTLKAFLQGFYIGNNTMNAAIDPLVYPLLCDTAVLQLAQPFFPYSILQSSTSVLDIHGNGVFYFNTLPDYDRYYIVLHHRNSMETWSSNPVIMNAATTYDFTTAQNKAFGNNTVDAGTPLNESPVWALYSGDISDASSGIGFQDGIVESQDYSDMENAVSIVLQGYVPQDITGDGVVESLDYSIMENNVSYVIFTLHP